MIFEQRYFGPMRTILPIVCVVVLALGLVFRLTDGDNAPRRTQELNDYLRYLPAQPLHELTVESLQTQLSLQPQQVQSVRFVLTSLQKKEISDKQALWHIAASLNRAQQDALAEILEKKHKNKKLN